MHCGERMSKDPENSKSLQRYRNFKSIIVDDRQEFTNEKWKFLIDNITDSQRVIGFQIFRTGECYAQIRDGGLVS